MSPGLRARGVALTLMCLIGLSSCSSGHADRTSAPIAVRHRDHHPRDQAARHWTPVFDEQEGCQLLPQPGSFTREFRERDCWVIQYGNALYEFYIGGTEPADPRQGTLITGGRFGEGLRNYDTPGRDGPVAIFLARWGFACFRTPGAGLGAFDSSSRRFETRREARATCRSHMRG